MSSERTALWVFDTHFLVFLCGFLAIYHRVVPEETARCAVQPLMQERREDSECFKELLQFCVFKPNLIMTPEKCIELSLIIIPKSEKVSLLSKGHYFKVK